MSEIYSGPWKYEFNTHYKKMSWARYDLKGNQISLIIEIEDPNNKFTLPINDLMETNDKKLTESNVIFLSKDKFDKLKV